MSLKNTFSKQTIIDAIKSGDFEFLSSKDISVKTAKTLIDKYYELPVDEVVKEALEAGLIEESEEERFRDRIKSEAQSGADEYEGMYKRDLYYGGYGPQVTDAQFEDEMMIIRDERVSADLYFTFGSNDEGAMIGWAKDDDKRSYSMFRNRFNGKYITVDAGGRMYLNAATPVLAARNVRVDATRSYKGETEVQEIKDAIKKGCDLTLLGLRDPNARPRDSYVSGRHYSSLDLLVNEGSESLVPTETVAGAKQVSRSLLRSGETEVTRHNFNTMKFDQTVCVILSARGDIANDGSTFEQIGSDMSREIADTVKSDPQAALELTELAVKMSLAK